MDEIQLKLNELRELIFVQNILYKELLTREEVSSYLGLSKSSIYNLTHKRKIPFYSPGGKKLYFKRSEIDEWVFSSRVAQNEELELEVSNYLSRTNKI